MRTLRIIGIAGTNGSGKDTLGELLAADYNYLFISVTTLLRQEAQRRGWPAMRQYTRQVSAEWRRQYGLATLVDRSVDIFNKSDTAYAGVAISSLRNSHEAERIHELGGTMVWIDADPNIRFARVQANATTRGRADDQRTYQQFLDDEHIEMYAPPGSDEATLNGAAVKEHCDIFLTNNSNSPAAFKQEVAKAFRF